MFQIRGPIFTLIIMIEAIEGILVFPSMEDFL